MSRKADDKRNIGLIDASASLGYRQPLLSDHSDRLKNKDLPLFFMDAIVDRREVLLVYGSDVTLRRVRPHAIGVSENDNPMVLAWQKEGPSQSGTQGWKYFSLDRIRAARVSDTTFSAPAPGYNPDNPVLFEVWETI